MTKRSKAKTKFTTWLLAILIAVETVCFVRALYLIDQQQTSIQDLRQAVLFLQTEIDIIAGQAAKSKQKQTPPF